MSNDHNNPEQDQLLEPSPNQINPGAAKPSDFQVQTVERNTALIAEPGIEGPSPTQEPIPTRNEVPAR